MAAATVGMVSLLIAPSFWAVSTIWYGGETRTPTAGPHPLADRGASANFVRDAAPLLDYLRSHQDTAKDLVASADEEFAQYAILHTNEPVIALGGFTGNDPVLSTTRLKALVDADEARSFLLEPTSRQRTRAARGISQHCTLVPKEAWQPVPSSPRKEAKGIVDPLYDCGPAGDS
jgi:4-amino-4-deoxy-L-arabinose transferase-like glycosyltransferase